MGKSSLYQLYEDVSEKVFQQQVIDTARLLGWLVYHPFDSRRSASGYPDLTLCKPDATGAGGGQVLFVELKTERGRLRAAQQTWLDALASCSCVEVCVWRPSQIDEIVERLQR